MINQKTYDNFIIFLEGNIGEYFCFHDLLVGEVYDSSTGENHRCRKVKMDPFKVFYYLTHILKDNKKDIPSVEFNESLDRFKIVQPFNQLKQ